MAVLRVWDAWDVTDLNGTRHSGGSRSAPLELTVDGYVDDDTLSLATDTTLSLWDSSAAVTTFVMFWLESDQDLYLEVTADRGGEVGTVVFGFIVEANTPFRLLYDDALALYTANFASGTADVIDRVRIRNVSGEAATIRRVIVA